MSGVLRPTLPHQPGESPSSLLSRLAALHGVGAREFCRDLGLGYQAVANGCGEALAALASLAGVALRGLVREAVRKRGGNGFEFRGETLARGTLRRSRVLVCPHCLAEDVQSDPVRTGAMAYGRSTWCLDPIRTCRNHRSTLVQVAHVKDAEGLHDFAANSAAALADLPALVGLSRRRDPSDLETYLMARLDGAPRTGAWLGGLDWHAVAEVCQLLGLVALHGGDARVGGFGDDDWHAAGDAGFAIARDGAAGVEHLLRHLDGTYAFRRSSTEGPQALYGELFKKMARNLDRTELDPLREVLREHVQRTRPVGPPDTMFGKSFDRRILHSVRSASLDHSVHPKRLRKILEAKLVIGEETKDLPDERVVFDAEGARGLLEKTATSVSLSEAETYLNAGRVQAKLLMKAGFIRPFVVLEGAKAGEFNFARAHLDRFLRKLLQGTVPIGDLEDACDIPDAARRVNRGAAEIVRLIIGRELAWVGRREGETGYLSVRVKPQDVKRHLHGERPPGYTAQEMSKALRASTGTISALIEGGHLEVVRSLNPINLCPLVLITERSFVDFDSTYVSLFRLANDRGVHFRQLQSMLAGAGIGPALHRTEFMATFYRRAEVG